MKNRNYDSDVILLCTIIEHSKYYLEKTVDNITRNFEVVGGNIFVLKTKDNDNSKFILTYNVKNQPDLKYKDILKSTFQIHRKKDYNVLYTLNALNMVVVNENGEQNRDYVIDWENYKNSLLLVRNNDELHKIPTVLYEIIGV